MRKVAYSILIFVGLAYLGICGVLFTFQRSLMYFPQPRAVTAPESTMHLRVDAADVVVTVRPHDGKKAIVYFGGNGEDVSVNLASFSAAFPECSLFFMHYPGYGGSSGSPNEEDIEKDATALFQKVYADHPEVVIIGRSLGSGVAVRLAAQEPASRLVLITPYNNLTQIAAARFPWIPVRILMRDTYDSGRYAPGIRIPTTFIVAANDRVIPRGSTDLLFSRFAAGVAAMTVIDGVGHDDIVQSRFYLETIRRALP